VRLVAVKQQTPRPPWPGAVERGLETLPAVSPLKGDLAGAREQCWMNIDRAEQEKGAPLTSVEENRILRGKPWRSRRQRERIARLRGIDPPFRPDE
jgi:hypothetical protein